MHQRFHLGRAALLVALVLLAAPAAAAARTGFRRFVVGPVAVGHGYSLFAFRDGCGSHFPNVVFEPPPDFGWFGLVFIKRIPGGIEAHEYYGNGPTPSCDFSTGRFKFRLGRFATIDVTFHRRASSPPRNFPSGCGGQGSMTHAGIATGTFRVDIDPAFFGSVDVHRTWASTRMTTLAGCNAHTEMDANFGVWGTSPWLSAIASPDGRTWVTIENWQHVARGLQSIHGIYLAGGPSLFDPIGFGSATVNGPGGPVTGQLSYRAAGPVRFYGGLSGSLTVAYDVIGTRILNGPAATTKYGSPNLFPCGPAEESGCFSNP